MKEVLAICVGDFDIQKATGQATILLPNGDRYVGQFKNHTITGRGVYIRADGSWSVGQFKDGILHGLGTSTTIDGTKHEGQFENGVFLEDEDSQIEEGYLKEKHELVIIVISGCFIAWLILSDLLFWMKVKIYLWLLFGAAVLGLCISITKAIFDSKAA